MQTALVEALDLVLARRAAGPLPGERRAAGRGTGTELAQVRPYQFGDDVRWIDAAASRAHGRPARARPRARAHADDVAAGRRLRLDGVRHRRPAEVRRRAGRRAGDRPARRAPRRPDRACSPAARPSRSSCRRAAAGPRWSRCARRSARVSPPTASSPRPRSRTGCAGSAGSPAATRSSSSCQRLPRGQRLGARARVRCRCAMTCSRSRSSTRVRRSCPTPATLTLVDPETGQRVEVDSSSAELRRRVRGGRARAARRAQVAAARAPARGTSRSRPIRTGCARSDGGCDELPGTAVPGRAGGRAARARGADPRPPPAGEVRDPLPRGGDARAV